MTRAAAHNVFTMKNVAVYSTGTSQVAQLKQQIPGITKGDIASASSNVTVLRNNIVRQSDIVLSADLRRSYM